MQHASVLPTYVSNRTYPKGRASEVKTKKKKYEGNDNRMEKNIKTDPWGRPEGDCSCSLPLGAVVYRIQNQRQSCLDKK